MVSPPKRAHGTVGLSPRPDDFDSAPTFPWFPVPARRRAPTIAIVRAPLPWADSAEARRRYEELRLAGVHVRIAYARAADVWSSWEWDRADYRRGIAIGAASVLLAAIAIAATR